MHMKIRSTSTVLTSMKIRSNSNYSLLATSHFENNNTMSDFDYNHSDYEDEDFDDIYDEHIGPDDDRPRINGVLVEELEDIKDYERGMTFEWQRSSP